MPETTRFDRLSVLIDRFRIRARVELGDGPPVTGVASQPRANLFLAPRHHFHFKEEGALKSSLQGAHPNDRCLVFLPGADHDQDEFVVTETGVDIVSAYVDIGGTDDPLALALPSFIALNLNDSEALYAIACILIEEVQAPRCGGEAVIDRLCEVMVIRLLRHAIETGGADAGLLAGLGHANLAHAIVAIHEQPGKSWNLEELAGQAGMSRTRFADAFRKTVGQTPGDYLSTWRLTLARIDLEKGMPLKTVARRVGFSSSAALSRAFSRRYGRPPVRATRKVARKPFTVPAA
ncbi:MAG: AraC family transcriptional regulator [Stappiaceae bacterium]